MKGFKGNCYEKLQVGESLCLENPCWNGGICKSLYNNTDYRCECQKETTGRNCRYKSDSQCASFDPCYYKNPCKNNATCITATINGF